MRAVPPEGSLHTFEKLFGSAGRGDTHPDVQHVIVDPRARHLVRRDGYEIVEVAAARRA